MHPRMRSYGGYPGLLTSESWTKVTAAGWGRGGMSVAFMLHLSGKPLITQTTAEHKEKKKQLGIAASLSGLCQIKK